MHLNFLKIHLNFKHFLKDILKNDENKKYFHSKKHIHFRKILY